MRCVALGRATGRSGASAQAATVGQGGCVALCLGQVLGHWWDGAGAAPKVIAEALQDSGAKGARSEGACLGPRAVMSDSDREGTQGVIRVKRRWAAGCLQSGCNGNTLRRFETNGTSTLQGWLQQL